MEERRLFIGGSGGATIEAIGATIGATFQISLDFRQRPENRRRKRRRIDFRPKFAEKIPNRRLFYDENDDNNDNNNTNIDIG